VTTGAPAKTIASALALGAFSVAIIAGLAVGNPADVVLARALVSMFGCYLVGSAVAAVGMRAVEEAGEQAVARIHEEQQASAEAEQPAQSQAESGAMDRAAAA